MEFAIGRRQIHPLANWLLARMQIQSNSLAVESSFCVCALFEYSLLSLNLAHFVNLVLRFASTPTPYIFVVPPFQGHFSTQERVQRFSRSTGPVDA